MQLYTYKIPLHPSPLPLKERIGLILENNGSWGEAAPLPGFSTNYFDSFAFALKCVHLPFPTAWPRIPLCALVSNLEEARLALKNGYRTLKLKVKHLSHETALSTIQALQFLPRIQLRIDVNRRWNLTQALSFFHALDPTGIEYFEEPLNDPRGLSELPPLPIALDETLLEEQAESFITLPNVHALVLKPTLLGNRLESLTQIRNKKLVFSSSFESAIGLLHIAHLQAQFAPQTAVGLDTYRSFVHNFLPCPVKEGMLSDEPLPPVNRSLLNSCHD